MTYVMSDLHGQYAKYRKMLELIRFSDEDELFVLGDVVDRGPDPVKILFDMSMRPNVFPIMGNHDFMALKILSKLQVEITEDNYATQVDAELLESLFFWQQDGGEETIRDFRRLQTEDREAILDYLSDFAPYESLTVDGNRFVLVHGGMENFSPDKPLSSYDPGELLTCRPDYSRVYYPDRYLVTGHTPTSLIDAQYQGKIYQKNRHIAIDCGAGFGGPLGCIRLDDFKEFYID
ncbi:MAG: metallophosphoesterase [Clostridia bacterium]|nr:metallophosphoesterase [Clostridia bacterium]